MKPVSLSPVAGAPIGSKALQGSIQFIGALAKLKYQGGLILISGGDCGDWITLKNRRVTKNDFAHDFSNR